MQEVSVASIEVTKLDNFPTTLFTTTGLNTLKQYLKVVATFADADNTTKEIDAKDYTIEGKLIADRTCTLTIKYGGKSKTISVTGVIAVEVIKLEATSTGESLYSSASEEDIKGILIVTATYNNDTDDVLAAEGYEVELPEGGLSSTNNTVTIKCGDKTATVTLDITDVASTGIEVEYTDSGNITVDSTAQDLLSGIKLTLKYNDGSSEVIIPTADMLSGSMDSIGDKTITVTYTDPENSTIKHTATFTVNVGKGDYDMSNVKFEDKTVTYNGQEHSIEISGDLPEGVSVSYEGNGQIEVNEEGYIVTAKFTHSNPNYNAIPDKTAKLIISDKPVYDMSGVTFEDVTDAVYDGEEHSIELSGELPEGVTYV
ncbi:MAG: hypothetical protein K2I79_01485, partial [Clostridia bacterium]|nr:hypothetical protein [Clostridia bacterium]